MTIFAPPLTVQELATSLRCNVAAGCDRPWTTNARPYAVAASFTAPACGQKVAHWRGAPLVSRPGEASHQSAMQRRGGVRPTMKKEAGRKPTGGFLTLRCFLRESSSGLDTLVSQPVRGSKLATVCDVTSRRRPTVHGQRESRSSRGGFPSPFFLLIESSGRAGLGTLGGRR